MLTSRFTTDNKPILSQNYTYKSNLFPETETAQSLTKLLFSFLQDHSRVEDSGLGSASERTPWSEEREQPILSVKERAKKLDVS